MLGLGNVYVAYFGDSQVGKALCISQNVISGYQSWSF